MGRNFTGLVLFLVCFSTWADPMLIRYLPPEIPDEKAHLYYVDMLKLALDKTTEQYGSYKLSPLKYYMVQTRAIKELSRNQKLDVYWTMTSKERESKLMPIRVPLLKGLLGFRIFIIRKGDQEKFDKVKNLKDLETLTAGQGHDWPDTEILKNNGVNVIEVTDYHSIFTMLQKHRVDYFPRGLNEPWGEIEVHKDKDFTVEKKLMFYYPAPIYFFVNPENQQLAERIEKGLWIAINDGSFDKLFKDYPGRAEVFQKANIKERIIFKFNNPLLTPETPLENEILWFRL